jgi:hypothetical protein
MNKREPTYRVCRVCGDPFAVRYRNQSVCDYNSRQASEDCIELQDELVEAQEERQEERESATCEREGCETPIYHAGRGRPRRFCSEAHKKAHARALKRTNGA